VLAMARHRDLERRFVAMLNPTLNRKPASRTAVLVVCGLALVITVPLFAVRAGQESKPAVATPKVVAAPEVVSVAKSGTPASAKPAVRKAAAKPAPRQGLADGSLAGSVTDGSGAFVPGVALTVSSTTQMQNTVGEREVQTTVSDEAGRYNFAALTPGQYWLKAEAPGFMTYRTVVPVERGQTFTQNVTLSVGTIRQYVIVTAVGQPKPPIPDGVPQRIRVGGNVTAANLTSQVRPVYPQNARDAGIEGTVHLQALIGTDGALVQIELRKMVHLPWNEGWTS
jgi:Carboxypeptidase regulatory-like domain/Gram-negative bacterial TonB protein C-terminal